MRIFARRPWRLSQHKTATAFNADLNNRQLHPDERRLAAELARRSAGRWTQAAIENALRNSGNRARGEDVTSGMVVGLDDSQGIYDPGAVFQLGAPGSNALVQQLPNHGRVDPELAAFIRAHTGGASHSPYHWNEVQLGTFSPAPLSDLRPTPSAATNGCVTAECAAGVTPLRNPVRDAQDVRRDVADGAALVSRGAGIVEASATTAAVIPGAHQPGAVTAAVTAAVIGFAANAVEQAARPDQKKFFINQILIGVPADQLTRRYPLLAPVINEAAEVIKNQAGQQ